MDTSTDSETPPDAEMNRREFLSWAVMGGSLAVSYGLIFFFGGSFLYPKKQKLRKRDIFVASKNAIAPGKPLTWTAPNGQKIIINQVNGELLALSNICPHLGCKVHWESNHDRFFCPCHAGTFDRNGVATAGPPKAEGKNLKRYELSVEGDAIYLKWEEA